MLVINLSAVQETKAKQNRRKKTPHFLVTGRSWGLSSEHLLFPWLIGEGKLAFLQARHFCLRRLCIFPFSFDVGGRPASADKVIAGRALVSLIFVFMGAWYITDTQQWTGGFAAQSRL